MKRDTGNGILGGLAATLLIITTGCSFSGAAHGPGVTTQGLLREMIDLPGLAETPEPEFKLVQFSSYDRASKSPKEEWFANNDRGQYLRVEQRGGRAEHVMMDMRGPGAIVRIWSANPSGMIRFYFDGADTPAFEAKMAEMLGGSLDRMPAPISGERSRGWNCFFPITFAGQCKVTCDAADVYYHINARKYPSGTQIDTFDWRGLEAMMPEIKYVAYKLARPREASAPPPDAVAKNFAFTLNPGESRTFADIRGAQAVRQLVMTAKADDRAAALRECLLTIRFDQTETVNCPLGDFFGTAPGANPYESLPCGITADGEMWAHWVMPFSTAAEFTLKNTGRQTVVIDGRIAAQPRPWDDRSLYFHATWQAEAEIPTRPMKDLHVADITGAGVYVGTAMSITNPVEDWWGEGDEKIYVDGERFPSFFGTGTEDYFGYAWCCPEKFTHAYHAQPRCDGPGNFGHTSVNRWHIFDRIPFSGSLRFDLELWHWHKTAKVSWATVAYWYGQPGARERLAAPAPALLRVPPLAPYKPREVPKVAGAIEGEQMRIIESVAELAPQPIRDCSGDSHLFWLNAKPGARIVLGFNAPAAGRYRVLGRFLKSWDYGIVKLSINGAPAKATLDLYSPEIAFSNEFDLGEFDLTAGENRITVEIVGINDKSEKKYGFGLDYIRLEPAAARPSPPAQPSPAAKPAPPKPAEPTPMPTPGAQSNAPARIEPLPARTEPPQQPTIVEPKPVAAQPPPAEPTPARVEPKPAPPRAPQSECISLLGRPLMPIGPGPERDKLEADLAAARAALAADPGDIDKLIWVGRRLGYLWQMNEAIEVFSEGIAKRPDYAPLYRHRGHRYISTRQFDRALADLQRAADLVRGRPDEIEPDGQPNAQNKPLTTLQFNIWYHLGLAHYLKGDFEQALTAYRTCTKHLGGHDDNLVAVTDWMYMSLRRLGRDDEANALLKNIRPGMNIIENTAYYQRVLMYKGLVAPRDLAAQMNADERQQANIGYGLANWHLCNGDEEQARALFDKIVNGSQWPAFGFIAAEAELARLKR